MICAFIARVLSFQKYSSYVSKLKTSKQEEKKLLSLCPSTMLVRHKEVNLFNILKAWHQH